MSNEIKTSHPDLYNEIGRPALFADQSGKEQWRFLIFVLTREYASMGSWRIRLLGDIMWLCSIASLFLFYYLLLFHFHDFDVRG